MMRALSLAFAPIGAEVSGLKRVKAHPIDDDD